MFKPLSDTGPTSLFALLDNQVVSAYYSRAARQGRLNAASATRTKSRFAGISRVRRTGNWEAAITDSRIPGRRKRLGTYADDRLAALAYDAALVLIGDEPVNAPASYFAEPHSPELQAFMRRIAERIGRPYPTSQTLRDLTAALPKQRRVTERTPREHSNADAEADAGETSRDNPSHNAGPTTND